MTQVMKLKSLGLEAYPKPGTTARWLLPVCASQLKERLGRLNPNNPGNWEDTDIDGCPTVCYRMTTKQIRAISRTCLTGAWMQLCGYLGKGPAEAFFHDLWLRAHNAKARARNRWEYHHGGIRAGKFDRGMSVRAAAPRSII